VSSVPKHVQTMKHCFYYLYLNPQITQYIYRYFAKVNNTTRKQQKQGSLAAHESHRTVTW